MPEEENNIDLLKRIEKQETAMKGLMSLVNEINVRCDNLEVENAILGHKFSWGNSDHQKAELTMYSNIEYNSDLINMLDETLQSIHNGRIEEINYTKKDIIRIGDKRPKKILRNTERMQSKEPEQENIRPDPGLDATGNLDNKDSSKEIQPENMQHCNANSPTSSSGDPEQENIYPDPGLGTTGNLKNKFKRNSAWSWYNRDFGPNRARI